VYDLLAGKVKATESLSVAEDYSTGEVHAVVGGLYALNAVDP
jgi:hypothetical protein